MQEHASQLPVCPAECPGCFQETPSQVSRPEPLRGRLFVAASALTFLVPLSGAAIGALFLGGTPIGELIGGVAGLTLGLAVVRAIAVLGPWWPQDSKR